MRRFFIKILIIFIFSSNIAWAADAHAEAFLGHGLAEAIQLDSVQDTGGLSDAVIYDYDHCCHGTAHYLGFPVKHQGLTESLTKQDISRLGLVYHTYISIPPTQPPKI
ncbi:MAG: hypothetical protein BMS9Abin33_0809 [Gammaproteobacteria bacterium]|nr:MAG: hypothetical protein BMS9Abin33_0809 [Gammaproteobacteria bacterium]